MAFVRTLAQLRTSVQVRGRYERSNDITAAVLLEVINDALVETYDLIIGKWDDYYVKVGASFPSVAAQDTYALATDFYKLRLVEIQDGTRWRRLLPMSMDDMGARANTAIANQRYRYRVNLGNLILSPPPSGTADTFRVWYIPIAPQLVNDADTVTFDVPQEQKLVLHVALRDCLQRQDLPTMEIDAKIAALVAGLRTAADGHDATEPFYLSKHGPGAFYDDDDEADFW